MEGGAKTFTEAMSADPESVPLLSGQQVAEQCTGGGTADWALPTGKADYGGTFVGMVLVSWRPV